MQDTCSIKCGRWSPSLLTGKGILFSGFRQVLLGLTAATVTYGIGSFIGVSLAG